MTSTSPTSLRMRAALLIAAALQAGGAAAASIDTPALSFARGQALYERHCIECHTPDIHRRPNRLPMTRDELFGLVDTFRRVRNLGWTPEEIEDVVEYLNQTRYRFTR